MLISGSKLISTISITISILSFIFLVNFVKLGRLPVVTQQNGRIFKHSSEKAWERKRDDVLYGIVYFISSLPLCLILAQMRIEVNGGVATIATILQKHSEKTISRANDPLLITRDDGAKNPGRFEGGSYFDGYKGDGDEE